MTRPTQQSTSHPVQRDKGTPEEEATQPGADLGAVAARPRRLRFGDFEFDAEALELHRDGKTIRLQPQPARLLHLLLTRADAVVSRDVVRRHLWPNEVHVEFDQSINSCVKRIRVALGDSAETPRYIETLPRLGYRFLQTVTAVADECEPPPGSPVPAKPSRRARRAAQAVLAAAGAALVLLVSFLYWQPPDSRSVSADEAPRLVLAVLPFAALDNWNGAEPFRQALAQELITSLAQQGPERLAVVVREGRAETRLDAPSARAGADFVLDGRVQRGQGRLRVWARLLLAKDGTVLWTEAYDGVEEEILAFQVEVSSRIGNAVLDRLKQLVEESLAPHRQS